MAAPKTVITIRLDGSNKDFEIPFEYLARKFVVITLIGTDRKVLTLGTDYRFTQRTIITTTQSWGPAQGYTLLEIRRLTSATERLVDFSDGSVLRAYDLNISNVQSLHIAEEGRDIATDTIGVDNDGNLDARGRRIVNLADAVNPGDAVTLKQNQEWGGSALNQADRATQQANLASAARQGAESAQALSQSARDASIAARDLSQRWAANPEDVVVSGSLYSSLHYAAKAAARSDAANLAMIRSESARDRSETGATTSTTQAGIATTQADRAKTEADKLANFNGLAAAIESVNGTTVSWRGNHRFGATITNRGDGDVNFAFQNVDQSNSVRMTLNSAGEWLLIDDSRGKIRLRCDTIGNTETGGTITAKGGSGFIRAVNDTANSHLWLHDSDGAERGLMFAGRDSVLRLRGGGGPEVRIQPNGDLLAPRNIGLSDGRYLAGDGNIVSPIYPGGNLANALTVLNTGVRRMTRTQIWTGTAGNGSLLVLSDDVFNYETLHVNFGSATGVLMQLNGLRELANLPIGTKFNINHSEQGAVDMSFEDTDTNQRRRLRLGNFTASGWFNLYGMKSRSY